MPSVKKKFQTSNWRHKITPGYVGKVYMKHKWIMKFVLVLVLISVFFLKFLHEQLSCSLWHSWVDSSGPDRRKVGYGGTLEGNVGTLVSSPFASLWPWGNCTSSLCWLWDCTRQQNHLVHWRPCHGAKINPSFSNWSSHVHNFRFTLYIVVSYICAGSAKSDTAGPKL